MNTEHANTMLSFIIINYKSEDCLLRCLQSIKNKVLGIEYEIIIFNNDTKKITLPEKNPSHIIIEHGHNLGFGNACNIACEKSNGKILFFLNPDTEILSGEITKILPLFEDKNIGAIAPEILSEDGNIEKWSFGTETTPFSIILNNFRKLKLEDSTLEEPDWISGAAIIIPRDVFEKIGGFDKNFFMYFEDVDLCKRLKLSGLKIKRLPSLKIKHFGGRSFANKKIQKNLYYASQDLYISKHFGNTYAFILKVLRFFHK